MSTAAKCEADSPILEFNNDWIDASIPSYILMLWCLNTKDKFTFGFMCGVSFDFGPRKGVWKPIHLMKP
jgi:hypothetical protein